MKITSLIVVSGLALFVSACNTTGYTYRDGRYYAPRTTVYVEDDVRYPVYRNPYSYGYYNYPSTYYRTYPYRRPAVTTHQYQYNPPRHHSYPRSYDHSRWRDRGYTHQPRANSYPDPQQAAQPPRHGGGHRGGHVAPSVQQQPNVQHSAPPQQRRLPESNNCPNMTPAGCPANRND